VHFRLIGLLHQTQYLIPG